MTLATFKRIWVGDDKIHCLVEDITGIRAVAEVKATARQILDLYCVNDLWSIVGERCWLELNGKFVRLENDFE